jgi:hypothetical protein
MTALTKKLCHFSLSNWTVSPSQLDAFSLRLFKSAILVCSCTHSGMPSGGSTTDRMLSMSLYFRIRSFTVVDVREGDAFTCEQKCFAALMGKYKKAIPLTGCRGLQGCEMLRIPHCLDNGITDGSKAVSSMHRLHCTPQKHYFSASDTHFC